MGFVIELFNNYGYAVLLIALILELIAFPLPGEVLMTYCGYVIYEGKMSLTTSIIIATFGVCIGATLSYFIGKILGESFFRKHGHYVHMDKNRLDKISTWFEKYGRRLLVVAYFIPGVRHFTGYFSGISDMSYKKFSVNAYIGALIWTTTFILLGKFLGTNWHTYHDILKKYLLIGILIFTIIAISIYFYKNHKERAFKCNY